MTTARTNVADVAVIGLGAVGSAVAHYLAAGGAKVVGVDRYTPPHTHGSSHGATRITRLAIGEGHDYVPIVQRSHLLWRALEAECGETLMITTGGLVIASAASAQRPYHGQAAFFEQTVSAAERFGIVHERLTAAEIRKRFPAFMPGDDERGYWERDAGILLPEGCVAAQLQAAARVVVATGAWLPAMLPLAQRARFAVQRQVLHWFASDAPDLFAPGRCPVFIWMHGIDGAAFYGFPKADGYDGVKVATEQVERATTPEAVDRVVGEEETARMYETHIRGRLRGVTSRSVHDATCLYTSTADARFVIDRHPELANVTVVSACSGHGFKHSAGVGEAVADGLLGRVPRVDLSPFATLR